MLYDRDIREPLFDFLEAEFGKMRILEEKRTGRSRADVVMVLPEALCGIEIKSDADSYTRLKSQIRDYDQYYDRNIIVAGTSHARHVEEHVPEYWGIITVEETEAGADFYFLRRPGVNPKMIPELKIGILWRPELARIQELNGLPKYARESKAFVQKKILEKVDEAVLRSQISQELFERDYTEIAETIREYRKEHAPKKPAKRTRRRRRF